MPEVAELPVFDLPDFAGRLGDRLHRAGVAVTAERAVRFVEILHLMPPVDRDRLYWAARLAFLTGCSQVATFDAVFGALFAGRKDPASSQPALLAPGRRPAPRPAAGTGRPPLDSAGSRPPGGRPSPSGRRDSSDRDAEAFPSVASHEESLASKDFAVVTDDEQAALRRLLAALVVATPRRRRRRTEPRLDGGPIDLRRTLRHSRRTGGDPARLARRRPTARPRPLVLLCDISGSMEPYSRTYLQFFQAAATGVRADAFVFATRLTRLTAVLRTAGGEAALARAGVVAPDWSGGTRIGQSLADFNNRYGRPGMARGAVVVIFSDGWERDDPAAVAREMARLRRLAYRVIWVNPRKAAPAYLPLAAGMAAALPFVDSFVSGHNVVALAEVIAAIADGDERKVKAQ
jgi:hypothetical protein